MHDVMYRATWIGRSADLHQSPDRLFHLQTCTDCCALCGGMHHERSLDLTSPFHWVQRQMREASPERVHCPWQAKTVHVRLSNSTMWCCVGVQAHQPSASHTHTCTVAVQLADCGRPHVPQHRYVCRTSRASQRSLRALRGKQAEAFLADEPV